MNLCRAGVGVIVLWIGIATVARGADLTMANRVPAANEWGYRPADGARAAVNPPSLIWLHEKGAATYAVQWAPAADFGADAVTVENLPFNTYTHHATLKPGTYWWRYRYTAADGRTSGWSAVRSVVVDAAVPAMPMPTRAQQAERMPKGHPRLFVRPEDVPRLRALAAGELKDRAKKLLAEADALLRAAPTPEPTTRASNRDDKTREWWWSNRTQTERACNEACSLAFAYLLSGDEAYGKGARDRIVAIAKWDPDGPTNLALNDEAFFPILYRLARAYDWAYAALSEADRALVRASLGRRANDLWVSKQVGRGVGHLTAPYESHANRAWHKLGECAIALFDETPDAPAWLDYAVNKFYAAYPVWSDEDGGWHEGLNYNAGYMAKVVWWLQASRAAIGLEGLRKPYFANVGDFYLYSAPPNSPNMGLGDLSFNRPGKGWGGFLDYFSRTAAPGGHAAHWRWWAQQWGATPEGGVMGFLYAAALPPAPDALAPADLPPSKVFHGIGVASLHRTLLDARQDVHLTLKSSPMGSQSHGHQPQNSIALNAYGESLVFANTYRDYHGSPFHYRYVHSSAAQNTVLVNGEGQVAHKAGEAGRIVAEKLSAEADYVAGDATAAYGGRVRRFVRHVVFVKPDVIVIFDDLATDEPATFQFMLHALEPWAAGGDAAAGALGVRRGGASLGVRYLPPAEVGVRLRLWEGFDPPPTKPFPAVHHAEAGTTKAVKELAMVTVLLPRKGGEAGDAVAVERVESATAVGARVTHGGRVVTVAFRKPGVTGPAEVAGVKFDGPFGTASR